MKECPRSGSQLRGHSGGFALSGFEVMSRVVRRAVSTSKKAQGKPGRKDIQGLRAFAVVAVILDHLLGWPSGGFIGVDIFFVISGFLITGLLLREHERTGSISFTHFYRRRAKRILPASVLVLVTTLVASFAIFGQSRFISTLWDGVWAFLFAGNWRFAAAGTDYFQADGPTSPLQHFWSLAVEEQFYFVWPWIMLAVFAVFTRQRGTGSGARIAVGAAIALISAASFAWALWETVNIPTQAYFSTFSRVWELGIGASLAVVAPLLVGIPDRLRPVLAWIGLAGMIASPFVIHEGAGFPAPAAALPVLSTALVIAAGTGTREQKHIGLLTNPVSGYIGDISYSLYLWHFPIIILAGAVLDLTNPVILAALAAAMLVVSVYSYHLVEDPIRKSKWLTGRTPKASKQPVNIPDSYKYMSLSLLALVTAAVCAFAVIKPSAPTSEFVAAAPTASASASAFPAVGPETTALQTQIAASLGAVEWPNLDPTMDEAIASRQAPDDVTACGKTQPVDDAACTWGDPRATRTALIVGDSISMTYVGAIREALGDSAGWDVKSYGTFGCPFMEATTTNSDAAIVEACPERKNAAVEAINALKPDVVFIANGYGPRTVVGTTQPLTPVERADSTQKIVDRIKGAAANVVFLTAPPSEKNVTKCYTKVSNPADCISGVTDQWSAVARAEEVLANKLGAQYIDSQQWFCVNGRCPSFVGTTPVKQDEVHMTQDYAKKIGPAIRENLTVKRII